MMKLDGTCVLEREDDQGIGPVSGKGAPAARDTMAVVLAGVHAWGGNALDQLMPRPMLPVVERPLIAHTLDWLRRSGVPRASICANSGTHLLRAGLGDGRRWGIDLEYYEDLFPRGPAGCVSDAVSGIGSRVYVVVEGTVIPEIDLAAMIETHHASRSQLTLAAALPRMDGENTDTPLIPLGVYLISPEALREIPPHGYQDIKEALIPRLDAHGDRVRVHVVPPGSVLRVSDAASYLAATRSMLLRMVASRATPEEYTVTGEAFIHESAIVDPTVRLSGPVCIGPGSTLDAGSIVSGPACVGAGCRMGRGVILSRSVVWDQATLGDSAVVDQSVITAGAEVEPGLVVRCSLYTSVQARPVPFWDRLTFGRPRGAGKSHNRKPNGRQPGAERPDSSFVAPTGAGIPSRRAGEPEARPSLLLPREAASR